jgi:hypothetical protein
MEASGITARMLALLLTLVLQEPIEPFDPVRHESLDRSWALEIDPVERRGAGPADYRFLHASELVWSGRLPFALDQLSITDDGFVVGCASTLGRGAWEGELLVVRITPAGVARVCAVTPKRAPDAPHGPSSPRVGGVRISTEPASFTVYLDGIEKERRTTWSFTLPDGAPIPGGPREKSPWFEREWTADPIDEPRPVERLASLDVSALSVVRADPLGEFRLATTVPAQSSAFVAVARDGAIAVLDGHSGALALHDASGQLRFTTTVRMEKLSPDALDATRDDGWIVQGGAWVHLDRGGAIVEARPREGWGVRELPALGDTPRRAWRLESRGVELRDAAGVTKKRVERGPDRRWFRRLSELRVTADGGAVVIEEGRDDLRAALHAFAPDGTLTASIGLPELPWRPRASVSGNTVFVPTSHGDVLAIDTRDGKASRVSVGARESSWGCVAIVPSPDGRELWRFTANSAQIARFALPGELR